MKRIIQRNLDLSKKYTLVGVTHTPVIDGCGSACENCGRAIANIATIKDQSGSTYLVGLDCLDSILETTRIFTEDSAFQYRFLEAALSKAKSLRAKILKNRKKYGNDFRFKIYESNVCFGFDFYVKNSPAGFDYTFNPDYKELTISYLTDLN